MRLAPIAALLLVACSEPASLDRLTADGGPVFDPVRYWTGHAVSWGVLENRSGEPTGRVTTDCRGVPEGADGLHMVQHLDVDGAPSEREWHMRRIAPGRYEATASDMIGTVVGEAHGRAFHWTWTLALDPGNSLKNVSMDQWMYLMDDGALLNHTTIGKLGVTVAQVSEAFHRVGP